MQQRQADRTAPPAPDGRGAAATPRVAAQLRLSDAINAGPPVARLAALGSLANRGVVQAVKEGDGSGASSSASATPATTTITAGAAAPSGGNANSAGSAGAAAAPAGNLAGLFALPPAAGLQQIAPLSPQRIALHAQAQAARAAELAQQPRLMHGDILYSSRAPRSARTGRLPRRAERSVYLRYGGRIRMHHPDGPMVDMANRMRLTFLPRPVAAASSSSAAAAASSAAAAAAPAADFHTKDDYHAWVGRSPQNVGRYPHHMLKPAKAGDPGKLFEIGADGSTHPSRGRPEDEAGIRDQHHLDHIAATARGADIALAGYRLEHRTALREVRRLEAEVAALHEALAAAPAASTASSSSSAAAAASAAPRPGHAQLQLRLAQSTHALTGAQAAEQWAQAELTAAAAPHNRAIRRAYLHPPAPRHRLAGGYTSAADAYRAAAQGLRVPGVRAGGDLDIRGWPYRPPVPGAAYAAAAAARTPAAASAAATTPIAKPPTPNASSK